MDKPIPEAVLEASCLCTDGLCGGCRELITAINTLTAAQQQGQAVAYPTGSDREVLQYLMQQFDAEQWYCPRCGHSEATADMDSADYLRRYLAAAPPSAPVGVEGVRQRFDSCASILVSQDYATGYREALDHVALAQQPAAVDEFVTIDGKRYDVDIVRTALLGLASDLATQHQEPTT